MRRVLLAAALIATGLTLTVTVGGAKTLRTLTYTLTAPSIKLDVAAGRATTTGSTAVESPQLSLKCGHLEAQFDDKGEELLTLQAHQHVSFSTTQTVSNTAAKLTGASREATLDNGAQTMVLTGDCAVHVEAPQQPPAKLIGQALTVRLAAPKDNLQATGNPKLTWGDREATADKLAVDFGADRKSVTAVRMTGDVLLIGTYVDKKTGKKQPVQARGDRVVWSQAGGKAVLSGNARVDFEGASRFRDATLEGEEITVLFEPKLTIEVTSEGEEAQSTVTATTVDETLGDGEAATDEGAGKTP